MEDKNVIRLISTTRRDGKNVVFLLLITLWVYAGFYFQSRIWTRGDGDNKELVSSGVYKGKSSNRDLIANIGFFNSSSDITYKSNGSVVSLFKTEKRGKKPRTKVLRDAVRSEVDVTYKPNRTYGLLVGPFGSLEDAILEKRFGTCDTKGVFGRLVWSRKFVLIVHEVSMTGAPLAMMELATAFLSCGASISVIVLNKRGGLIPELSRRKINVLEVDSDLSFKTAMEADLIIAGSAVCSSWIEHFDRSKHVLNQVTKLIFISESQSKHWCDWCEEENVRLNTEPGLVPLSVDDELAFVAGPARKTIDKRMLLRDAVRREMGLSDDDMLVITLSTIYPGKGHLLLLESTRLVIERGPLLENNDSILTENLKILIGSVGSECIKVSHVESLYRYLSIHSNLSKFVMWTPVTTRVSALYAAADVYVMNSQGLGETFGRVTIEAMAFGLPVIGTDAGGTREIVEHNVTGLLYPLGRAGARVLARNLEYLLKNPSKRQEMGKKGREKVEKMYLKKHMLQKFGEVLYMCMKIK